MSEYSLGETLYFFEYPNNQPQLQTFVVAAIRETAGGFTYSNLDNPASPYLPEDQLFPSIEDAVEAGIEALEGFLPPPPPDEDD